MNAQIIEGANNGRHIVDGPLTVAISNEAVPGLIRNAIDQRIVKVRPMSTPIDQISRCGGSRRANAIKVDYYSVDPKKTEAELSSELAGGSGNRRSEGVYTHIINTDNDLLFEPSETVMFPSVKNELGEALVCYVVSRVATGGVEIMPVNADIKAGRKTLPTIASGTKVIRMGRAATELDVQTPQFQSLPTKRSNHCQIFKMQVEESTLHKIANKEIGWSFSDQEEAAIIDMRLGMEKNFMFGSQAIVYDPVKNEDVYLTGGIWNQTDNFYNINSYDLNEQDLIEIACEAFTGNCGSKRKLMLCGSDLMTSISKINCSRITRSSDTFVKWGLTFQEISTNFGKLHIIHSETFDQCGHKADGMIIDPDYLTKYVHIPFHTEQLDLRRSGQRNSSAVVITEASCLVLRYPDTHMKLIHV